MRRYKSVQMYFNSMHPHPTPNLQGPPLNSEVGLYTYIHTHIYIQANSIWFMLDTNNPFFLVLKLPNKDWFGTSVFFWLITLGFLIVVIENKQENRMVKQWVQPPTNKNGMVPGRFLLGSHLKSFIFIIYYQVLFGILGESFKIQFLAIFYIDINKGFNHI